MGRQDRRDRQNVYGDEVAITLRGANSGDGTNVVATMVGEEVTEEKEKERKTPRRPSEEQRAQRRLSITFPTPEWKEALLEQADVWGVRASDFATFCIAYTMAAIESGELRRAPRSGPTRFYHRAGEPLELPWSPGDWTEEE